jgi:hypothetical protein
MVDSYREESQRQKLMVKKTKICDARLDFITTAFNRTEAD